MSKQTITLVGEDTERLLGMLRAMSGELEVDVVEDHPTTGDPMQDIVFFLDRISSHLARQDRKMSKFTSIESKLSRISLSLDRLVQIQQERLDFEREQAREEGLRIQK